MQPGDDPADRLLRVVLHVTHVRGHHVQAELAHQLSQLGHALLVRGDLRPQVREVGAGVTGRELGRGEQLHGGRLAQLAAAGQPPVVDQHAFLVDPGAEGRHGTRGDAADLGVMPAGGHEEQDVLPIVIKHRGDHGDVGQVRAAVVGVVEHVDIAGLHAPAVTAQHHFDALAHGAQVHRHVRGVRDELPRRVEDRTGEVEAFLDVDRVRGALQPHTHLLGHGHEQVVEDLQHHRVSGGAGVRSRRAAAGPGQPQVTAVGHRGLPARLQHGGGEVLGDEGRPVDHAGRAAAPGAAAVRPRPSRRR